MTYSKLSEDVFEQTARQLIAARAMLAALRITLPYLDEFIEQYFENGGCGNRYTVDKAAVVSAIAQAEAAGIKTED